MFISLVMSYNIKIKLNIYFIKYLTHIIILFFLEYIYIYIYLREVLVIFMILYFYNCYINMESLFI